MERIFISKEEFDEIYKEEITARKKQVLQQFLARKSDLEIAESLNITKDTVRQHLRDIAERLGLIDSNKRNFFRADLLWLCQMYL